MSDTLARLRHLRENGLLHVRGPVKCYWEAFDSKTQRTFDAQEEALRLLNLVLRNVRVTYFPAGSFYVGFSDLNIITPDLPSYAAALEHIIDNLPKENPA